MFGIFASITIKPARREQFLSTIRDTAWRSVNEEPGCVTVGVALTSKSGCRFTDAGQENRYLLYEVYVDERAFEEHLETAHARLAMEGSKAWAEGPFDVTRAHSVYPDSETAFGTVQDHP